MKQSKRVYNVFFNTHTVSGIVISIGLYICFLAGAFALFQTNINKWEYNQKRHKNFPVSYERVVKALQNYGYELRERTIFMMGNDNPQPYVMVISRPVKPKKGEVANVTNGLDPHGIISVKIEPDHYTIIDAEEGKASDYIGSFLYRLHYFDQLPVIGLYLSGLIALFFLFAIVTGTYLHWKKIKSNFFTFRLKVCAKNIWTDAHVALGIIGLPFQFMYAVTGALLGLLILVLLPSSIVLFGGNQVELLGYIAPAYKPFEKSNQIETTLTYQIDSLVQSARGELGLEENQMAAINLTNYGDKNAHLMVEFRKEKSDAFYDDTHITYRLRDKHIVEKKTLRNHTYQGSVLHTVRKLHFGHFGGYIVKAIYFLLSLITCFFILSGVMVWLEARDNKKYEKKRNFNKRLVAVYLGICLGLFPTIAFLFCLSKLIELNHLNRANILENGFFTFWLLYTIYAVCLNNNFKINQHALAITGVLGMAIPVLNGASSGLWFWKSFNVGYIDSFFIDVFWLCTGLLCFVLVFKIKPMKVQLKRNK